jgi:hypothetical protein
MIEFFTLVLTKIFSGGPESTIAILIFIIIGISWFVYHLISERKKLITERNEIVEKYNEKLVEIIDKSHASQSITTSAIHEIRIVLAEIKARQ